MTAVAAAKPAPMPWWIVLLEGIAVIILGGLMWTKPFTTANALVFFIAIYWLVSGVISIVRIFFDRRRWGWNLFMGIIGILAGYVLLDAGAGRAHDSFRLDHCGHPGHPGHHHGHCRPD